MARLFDDIHDPFLRDLCGTAVSEPAAVSETSEALIEYETDMDGRYTGRMLLVEREAAFRLRARRERMLARKIDLAYERGDLAAIAILEGPIYGYADRFMAEG